MHIILVCWVGNMAISTYIADDKVTYNDVIWAPRYLKSLHWRHNDHDGISNHQPNGCLLNRLFRRRSKKTSKLRVTGLCVGNSPGPVNSPHKGSVTRKMFPFDGVIMPSAFRLFVQQFVQAHINENINIPRHWPLWRESTGDRWIPLTRTSNAENVSILWRHHELVCCVLYMYEHVWKTSFVCVWAHAKNRFLYAILKVQVLIPLVIRVKICHHRAPIDAIHQQTQCWPQRW